MPAQKHHLTVQITGKVWLKSPWVVKQRRRGARGSRAKSSQWCRAAELERGCRAVELARELSDTAAQADRAKLTKMARRTVALADPRAWDSEEQQTKK